MNNNTQKLQYGLKKSIRQAIKNNKIALGADFVVFAKKNNIDGAWADEIFRESFDKPYFKFLMKFDDIVERYMIEEEGEKFNHVTFIDANSNGNTEQLKNISDVKKFNEALNGELVHEGVINPGYNKGTSGSVTFKFQAAIGIDTLSIMFDEEQIETGNGEFLVNIY